VKHEIGWRKPDIDAVTRRRETSGPEQGGTRPADNTDHSGRQSRGPSGEAANHFYLHRARSDSMESECALDFLFVAFSVGKPVPTFPENAVSAH
jgi:hypothetical protein